MEFHTESPRGRRRLRLAFVAVLYVVVLVQPVMALVDAGRVSWSATLVGALVGIVVVPLGWTAAGRAVGDWFRGIGVAGRVLAFVGFAVVVVVGSMVLRPPETPVYSFVVSMLVAFLVAHLLERVWMRRAAENRY